MNTFKELVDFVMEHKGTKTFMGYTEIHILNLLHDALEAGTLFYNVNNEGKIDGMIMAELRPNNILFVTENLSMNMHNLQIFAAKAHKQWPHHRLEWLKHGIHKQHDTTKFYEKLGI